ncbi:MAG: RHS repeat protein [Leptospiraceae bacterium]|nr:RHS repeat protein [Leptospiraceae bacterium]
MSNTNIQPSPALRMEAWSINCLVQMALTNSKNRNLLTEADSLTAHNVEYLFLMRLIILIHLIRRNAQSMSTHDEGGIDKFANGRLTKVVDAGGTLELGYDIRGNRVYQKRDIDDLKVIFRRTFDIQNRLESTTYPDGTKVYQKYAPTGHFSGITMDTFNGTSFGHTVGSYAGPVVENGLFKIIRETGNGVRQEVEYDPIKRRPKGLVTKLAGGHIESAVAYSYDERNNITKIEDTLVNARTQEFKYDAQNRLTEAKGKYGVETYTYGDNGNLMKKSLSLVDISTGSMSGLTQPFVYTYGNANHAGAKHAVTSVTSPNTGTIDYSYDESGNMETRATDTMTYNGQGKLKQIVTGGGDTFEYLYDSTGNRIRKKAKNSGVITYNFDGLYEITKTGSEGVPHTLYFKGLYGDVFAQMTRGDAVLRGDDVSSSKSSNSVDVASSSGLLSFAKGDDFPPGSFVKDFFCGEVAGSCSEYYLNAVKFYWVKGIVKGYTVVSRVEFRVGLWIMLIVMVYLLSQILSKLSLPSRTGINDDILESSLWLRASVAKTVTPLLTISILFTFTQCGVIGGDKSKNAPWMLLASGINQNTASVGDGGYTPYGGSGSSGSSSGNSSLVPVTGMYFLHPDHLGSKYHDDYGWKWECCNW